MGIEDFDMRDIDLDIANGLDEFVAKQQNPELKRWVYGFVLEYIKKGERVRVGEGVIIDDKIPRNIADELGAESIGELYAHTLIYLKRVLELRGEEVFLPIVKHRGYLEERINTLSV